VIGAFEEAITLAHEEPGVELCALNEGNDRLVMIEKYESDQARAEHAKGRGPGRIAGSPGPPTGTPRMRATPRQPLDQGVYAGHGLRTGGFASWT
jgi:hypothetical protein